METIAGFPFFPLEFTREGKVHDPAQVQALLDGVKQGTTDLLVISHGWNNDMAEARSMYKTFLTNARGLLDGGHAAAGRTYAVAGVFWPSKKFADSDLIPGGGAAGIGQPAAVTELQARLQELKGDFFDNPGADALLDEAQALAPQLEANEQARKRFGDIMIQLAPPQGAEPATEDLDANENLHDFQGDELLEELSKPVAAMPPAAPDDEDDGEGGAGFVGGVGGIGGPAGDGGDAAGIGDLVGGIVGGAKQAANLVTYYQMKKRAGIVGTEGLGPVLAKVRQAAPALRIHLAGHSFGARLVTVAAGAGAAPLPVATMSLLQGAYSHYGLARNYRNSGHDGGFRPVVDKAHVKGPIIITHTRNDKAVGLAYALASRLAGQTANALGDENDKFGGMGSNGAQFTPERVILQLGGPSTKYTFAAGKVHNLKADAFVSGHGDVENPAVVNAVLHAIATT
jgi:hypothetical protein